MLTGFSGIPARDAASMRRSPEIRIGKAPDGRVVLVSSATTERVEVRYSAAPE
jgi:hypothetical protein